MKKCDNCDVEYDPMKSTAPWPDYFCSEECENRFFMDADLLEIALDEDK